LVFQKKVMKGIVFIELLQTLERHHGTKTLQSVIEKANLPNNGVYNSEEFYSFDELGKIISAISKETKTDTPLILRDLGKHLFQKLAVLYPEIPTKKANALEFIASVETYIHPEIRKIYPNAQLPKFVIEKQDVQSLTMLYISDKKFEAFVWGLMLGCAEYYKQALDIEYTPVEKQQNYSVRFKIQTDKAEKLRAPGGLWNMFKRRLFGVK